MKTDLSIFYLYVPEGLPYGKIRRKFIVDWFAANPNGSYAVNCKHRPQVKHDPDLKRLLKIGFLKAMRQHTSRFHAQTVLVKA